MEQLIEKLEEIGFTKNEAKAYTTLLKESPLNGYEISKKSGVPRSMIYSVIAKLTSKEAIIELRTDPPTYIALTAKELITNKKIKTQETLNYLEQELQAIEKPTKAHVIKHIEERDQIMKSMQKLIKTSQKEVWLSAWEKELEDLRDAAELQLKKGISIYSLLFTDQETTSFGNTFYHHHHTAYIEEQRMGQRLTVVIRDNQEVLIAGFIDGQTPLAIQTTDSMLVLLAKEYIRHDMMMKVVSDKLGNNQLDALWRGDDLLNYIVNNKK